MIFQREFLCYVSAKPDAGPSVAGDAKLQAARLAAREPSAKQISQLVPIAPNITAEIAEAAAPMGVIGANRIIHNSAFSAYSAVNKVAWPPGGDMIWNTAA